MSIEAFFFLPFLLSVGTGLKFLLAWVGRKAWPVLHSHCGAPQGVVIRLNCGGIFFFSASRWEIPQGLLYS